MKKAIAILYSPKNLMDFLWLYLAIGKEYEWDVCCIPHGKEVVIREQARRSGIFNKVITDDAVFLHERILVKLLFFFRMFFFYITGRKKQFCKKHINKRFNYDEYNLIVTTPENSLLGGFLISLSDEKETIILEDGTRDYLKRVNVFSIREFNKETLVSIVGGIMSYLGYGEPSMTHPFSPTKNCTKYVSYPENLNYRNYNKICKLNDLSLVNHDEYIEILTKTFDLKLPQYNMDAILYTSPFEEDFSDSNFAKSSIEEYINRNYKNRIVGIKCHARDKAKYSFNESVNVIFLDETIPGEILKKVYKESTSLFMWPSTLAFGMIDNYTIFFFEKTASMSSNYNWKSFINIIEIMKLDINRIKCI
jgi:hypothetical protein